MTGGDDQRPPGWIASTRSLRDQHDALLLDCDGVVYIGDGIVPNAADALAAARAGGLRLAFVTNNASRTAESVAEHLTRIGICAEPTDVVTSAQAAAAVLSRQLPAGARVLVVGGEGLSNAVAAVGLVPVASADDDPAAVVQGFAPQVGWIMLVEACVAVRAGVPWVATNLDVTIPTPRGPVPGNGALVGVVRSTTGVDPTVTGKPFPPIMQEAVRRVGAQRPLVVGDRMDTDIAGAVNAGLPSMLVLTGVSGVRELIMAPQGQRPTYLAADLRGVDAEHPGCAQDVDGWWRCGRVAARVRGGQIEVNPVGPDTTTQAEALEAVRAVCSAVWDVGAGGPVGLDAVSAWTAGHGWDR